MARLPILPGTRETAGTVAIEYGIVLPVLLLFTFGTMDAARLLWTYITLSEATETAARCGAVNNTTTCPSLTAYAASKAWGISGVTAANFSTSTPSCGVEVVGTYTYNFFTPWFSSSTAPFGSTTTTLKATACYPTQ